MNKKTKPKTEKEIRRLTVLLTQEQFEKLEASRRQFEQTTGFEIGMSPFAARAMERGIGQ